MGIHEINNEEENKLVKELRDKGITVYSYSRLTSFLNCQYEYYNSYIKRNRGEDNIYSKMGSFIHNFIESAYRGEIEDFTKFKRSMNTELFKLELEDVKFPNDSIEKSWRADMDNYTENFKLLDGKFMLEKAYVGKFGDYYMMGYIDAIREHEDGRVDVIDWKTSSKFSSKKIESAGRQLVVYKMALEQKGMKIDKVMWNMLKYCYVSWKLKNGKVKQKMVNRGKLIKDMSKQFEKTMLESGMDEIMVTMILNDALKHNNFDMLPQIIKDTYLIEDALLEYEVTEEVENNTMKFIQDVASEIESKNPNNESDWLPLDIDKENFYCNTLCGLRNSCQFLQDWKKKNPFKKIGF